MHIMTAELAGEAQALAVRGQSRAGAGAGHVVAAELAEAHANLLAEKPCRERRAAGWPRTAARRGGVLGRTRD